MRNKPRTPPLDGSLRVIPDIVDFHAKNNPEYPWAVFPSPSDTGVISISFRQFAEATHRIAHALRPLPCAREQSVSKPKVVAVLIHCDTVLYVALLAGMIRAGLTPFPMSPRNTAAAVVNMLEKTSCHCVVVNHAVAPLLASVKTELSQRERRLEVIELPDLYDVFPALFPVLSSQGSENIPNVEPYPDIASDCPMNEPILYVHSSGSTGFPKPIPQTHTTMLEWCYNDLLLKGRDWECTTGGMALPTFHTIAIHTQLLGPLMSGSPVGLYTPQAKPRGHEGHTASPVVPTPQLTLETSRRVGCHSMTSVPTFLEVWAQSEEDVRYLASLKFVGCCGGPLSERSGATLITAGVKLYSVYGATEFGAPSLAIAPGERIPRSANDADNSASTSSLDGTDTVDAELDVMSEDDYWSCVVLSDRVRTRWDSQGDGTYELQVLTCETHHPSVENLPDVRGYATNDLFAPHPTKKGVWRLIGRKDDVVVLGSGEKVVALQQELVITSSPMVSGVVMFGRGRNQCGLLIEPRSSFAAEDPSDEAALIEFRNLIWPIVEEANRIAPTFARIFKEMITIADTKRPLPRAAKGTIVRKQALALYENEIERLYQAVEDSMSGKEIALPEAWIAESVEAWLIQHAAAMNEGTPVDPTVDVFSQGFDSLHATFLRNRIIGALRGVHDQAVQNVAKKIGQGFVFEHPTLRELAKAVSELIEGKERGVGLINGYASAVEAITSMLEKYSAGLPGKLSKLTTKRDPDDPIVVLLTGSTGNVGSHLLAALLTEPRVRQVYTLDRPSSGPTSNVIERQRCAFERYKLPLQLLLHEKHVPLSGDFGADAFGLEPDVYHEITSTTTHVIHNAWKVDFNHHLHSFEPLIAGTRKLIDACYTFSQPVRLLFSSSIAAALGWDQSQGPVPEEPLDDPTICSASGYGASKYIAENLLAQATNTGLQTISLRIGQICGAKTTGSWNVNEWVPILVKSSVTLGALPDLEKPVSWIPMDAVSQVFVDLILNPSDLPSLLNVVHPQTVTWRSVFECINQHLDPSLPFIPSPEWYMRLEKHATDSSVQGIQRIPAIKLLTFFKNILTSTGHQEIESPSDVEFVTTNVIAYSPAVQSMGPVGKEHAQNWVAYWKDQGFL